MRVLPVAAITPPVCSGQGEIALKKCYLDRGDRVEVKASWQKIIFLCSCIARNHK